MTTLSSPNLTSLRTKQHEARLYLSHLQPATLLTALVTGSPTRGQRSISYNTGSSASFATIEAGQTVIFGTAHGKQIGRVKGISGTASSGTIDLDENALLLTNADTITIYHNYQITPIPPSIRSQVFYKFYSTAYSNQNSQPNPVAIAGPNRAGFLSAGSIAFSLNSSASYAIADGATIASRVWSCVHNGGGTTGISFSSTTTANPTLTITEAGTYWLKLIVTDSNGKTQSTWRVLFVHDRAANAPYNNFQIQNFVYDWQTGGGRCSLTVSGNAALTDFPDNSLVILWYEGFFDGVEGYVNLWGTADNCLMAGYIRQDTSQDQLNQGVGTTSFEISTIEALLDNKTALGSISINATATPTKWWQYASWMTAGRSVDHLIDWHFWGVKQTCDVFGLTANALGVKSTDYTEGSLLQQVNGFTDQRGIFAKLMSDEIGRLHLVENSQMLDDATRAAQDTVFTLDEVDVSGATNLVRQQEKQIAFTTLDGFAFDGSTSTPYISIIPGYRESSISYIMPENTGGATANVAGQILASQADSNSKIGRYHAAENNDPREIRFTTPRNYKGAFSIVPSVGWYVWGIDDSNIKRAVSLNGRKTLCRNISLQFIYDETRFTGTIITDVVLEPEAIGPPGIQGNYPLGYPEITQPAPDWEETLNSVIMAYRDNTNSNVGKAVVGIPGSVAVGSPVTFEAGATSWISVVGLSETKAVVCFRDEGDTNKGKACVLTIAGAVVTPGTAAIFETGNTTHVDAVALSETQVLVCYRDNDNSNQGTACILDISGTTVTPAAPVVFEGGATQYVSVARLSATKAIAAYRDDGNSGFLTACVLDVTGSVITPATPAVVYGLAIIRTDIAALSSNSACITFSLGTLDLGAITVTAITTTFTPNTPFILDAVNGAFDDTTPGNHWLRAASATQLICAYQSANSVGLDYRAFVQAFTIDGTNTPVPGTSLVVGSFVNSRDEMVCLALVSSSKAIVFYGDALTNGRALTATFTGGVTTSGADEVEANAVYTTYTSIATLRDF